MTRSWDNLVSALAGAQMALGGKKNGDRRAIGVGQISPLDKPYCTMRHVNQPVGASRSSCTLLSSVAMAEREGQREKSRISTKTVVASVARYWRACLQRFAKICQYSGKHLQLVGAIG